MNGANMVLTRLQGPLPWVEKSVQYGLVGNRKRAGVASLWADNSRLCVVQHIPNFLSAMRIPTSLALLVVYDPRSLTRSWICLALVLLVMATDYLDGMIARKYSVQTKFGYLLDGLGDRAFHVSVFLILVTSGILAVLLAWVMIFREISQYAVRLVELDWYSSQSKIDRRITRIYAAAVQGISLIEVSRAIIAPSTLPAVYIVLINATLAIVATMSFSRIIPRLILAWRMAIDG